MPRYGPFLALGPQHLKSDHVPCFRAHRRDWCARVGVDGILKGAPCIHETEGSFDLVEKKKSPIPFYGLDIIGSFLLAISDVIPTPHKEGEITPVDSVHKISLGNSNKHDQMMFGQLGSFVPSESSCMETWAP